MSGNFSFLNARRGRLMSFFLLLVFLGSVGLDQVSKTEVQEKLLNEEFDKEDISTFRGGRYFIGSVGERVTSEGDIPFYIGLKFQYSRNPGAAFSMLADLDDSIRIPFFYGVTVVAIVMITFLLKDLPYSQHLTRIGLIFIASGAIGNFLDRLFYGYVVDFIDFDWNLFGWRHDFAIFNVADVAINIGIICYFLDFLLGWKMEKAKAKSEAPSADGEKV